MHFGFHFDRHYFYLNMLIKYENGCFPFWIKIPKAIQTSFLAYLSKTYISNRMYILLEIYLSNIVFGRI